jgi:PASTA domain
MSWLGTRRVAFGPVDRGLYNEFPVPPDWKGDIERRVFYDHDSVTRVDVSLRNFILTMSQGRADITGEVVDTITFVHPGDVAPGDLAAQLDPIQQSGAYDAGAVIMLGGRGAGRNYGFWSRFVMLEGVGVWAMELMHGLTGMADLYTHLVPHDLGGFDTMACACGTHLTAYTRMLLGWLDPSAIAIDASADAGFVLHATSLGPAPPGRVQAVQTLGSGLQVIVEARLRADQFDGPNQYNPVGIPGEGVIVYEVVGVENPNAPPESDPLISLLTPTALQPGQSVTSESGITVQVGAAVTGGFAVTVHNPTALVEVPDVQGYSPHDAALEIKHAGLIPVFGTGGQWVKYETPHAGTLVPWGSTVALSLGSGPPP